VSTLVKLRDYQSRSKQACAQGFRSGLHRVGISLPTGTGKTVIFASVAYDVWRNGKRVIILVHLDTLVEQTCAKLLAAGIPANVIGIVKAEKNQVGAPVIVASVQTLARPSRLEQIIPPHLTIVDEAHMSMSPRYLAYFRHVGAVPGGPGYLLGLTATWERNDSAGLGDVWEKIVFKRSIKWAVDNGFLAPPRAVQYGPQGVGSATLDTSGVRTIKDPHSENYGDYNPHDLEQLVMVDDLLETAIKGYNELGRGRDGNLLPAALFAPTQASVRYFLKGFNDAGIPAAEILAGTSKTDRTWNFAGFDAGRILVLGSCTALAVGWDSPRCCVMLGLRPTKSRLMFVQQIGRILRPWPGKTEGLLIDFVGLTDDKSLATVIDLSTTQEPQTPDYPCPECERGLCLECTGCRNSRCSYFNCTCDIQEDDGPRVPIPHTAKKITGTREVDLFAGTNARWLTTYRHVPFVQTAEHTYFIAPHEGTYAVGRCGSKSMRCRCHGNGTWLATGLDSAEALEIGSDFALEDDPSLAHKNASWRKGNPEANQVQIDYARSLGLDPTGLNKHELSDQISIRIASRLLASIGG
jgi:superfamily II DNA or RNA helicase